MGKQKHGESPYAGLPEDQWLAVTKRLLREHPLTSELADVARTAWDDVFETRIGAQKYRLGIEIQPSPQIMGNFLHELIPLIFRDRYPKMWCRQRSKNDKDLVCLFDPNYSVEIKTSSHSSQIFGNRSYGQSPVGETEHRKKGKSGYYLAINFEKFSDSGRTPRLIQVRFGWLDHTDWIAQKSPTGQQSRVSPAAYAGKFIKIYSLTQPIEESDS